MADQDDGITITLSAVQMAAVLESETVEQGGTVTNRVIGGLRILGCSLDALGAGALAAAPEPTMLTKAGAVGLALFAADQCTTGARQLWYGRDDHSLLDRSTSALARQLGASPQVAADIGMASEIVVPFGAAGLAGAVRVGAVRLGRISLMEHEAQQGSRLGGHTIVRHVGKDEAYLRARLAEFSAKGPRARVPEAISSFTSLRVAETEISRALQASKMRIAQWSEYAAPGSRMVPPLEFASGRVIGQGIISETGKLVQMSRLRIVLKKELYNGMPYYILTAFPIP